MGSTNHFISLQQAVEMTTRFRNEKENILTQSMKGQKILPICETFDRSAIDALLIEKNCTRIRVYFCMDNTLKVKLVIVGVDSNDQDILPPAAKATTVTTSDEVVVEDGQRCPDFCPPPSSLNS